MFNWVEFWRIGRQNYKANILRDLQCMCLMSASPIKYHDNPVIRIPGCYLIKKELHAKSISGWQDQTVNLSVGNKKGSISIHVLLARYATDD